MARSKAPAETKEEPPEGAEETVRVYPTHRLGPNPLRVAVPVSNYHTDELVIDDDGLDVDQATADHLIASRDATLEAPPKTIKAHHVAADE